MSGFANPSYQLGPRELYAATRSSLLAAVSNVLAAPTGIASGALPGDVRAVAVIVVRGDVEPRRRRREIVELDDAAGEIAVVLQPGVDDRHADRRPQGIVPEIERREEVAHHGRRRRRARARVRLRRR